MDSETAINAADVLLREPVNAKIGKPKSSSAATKPNVKEELQVITLSETTEDMIMTTLRDIYGREYQLPEAKAYEDSGLPCNKQYWVEQGTLIVRGGFDYSSARTEEESDEGRLKMFALMRLESYGFHKNHCEEAFEYCQGVLEDALQLLFQKYYNLAPASKEVETMLSEKELIEQRNDEKIAVESIYCVEFREKIPNHVWIFELQLDYLAKRFGSKQNVSPKKSTSRSDKRQLCKNMQKTGTCRFGNKCRYDHNVNPVQQVDPNNHLKDYKFELEIRFPKNSLYPCEPPLVFLKSMPTLPEQVTMHICKRLVEEAVLLAADGFCSVNTMADLIKNEHVILEYLDNMPINFLGPKEKLFPDESQKIDYASRPSHYKKGLTGKDGKKQLTSRQIKEDDAKLAEAFRKRMGDAGYMNMMRGRHKLPAWPLRNDILDTIDSAQVCVISGETGCGKSTQVPQFILDEWMHNFFEDGRKHVEIVCTQPRRISALGVAERVAAERADPVGNIVGYQIRLENKMSSNTRLTFCTTGILLRRLESDSTLTNVTHIIVDEVHERSEESDFLLMILRDLLPIRPDLKVILMSATLNAQIFAGYFGTVPVLDIPGRTFPVDQIYLEDMLDMIDYFVEPNSEYTLKRAMTDLEFDLETIVGEAKCASLIAPKACIPDEDLNMGQIIARYQTYTDRTCKNLYLMDPNKINYDLIQEVILWIVQGDHDFGGKGAVLVFLPGIGEITALYDMLLEHREFDIRSDKYILLPLHSSLTSEEQALVFKNYGKKRKIVLTTNIAETSVTIDDCVFVIDAGKMKEKHFDSNRNMESLDTVWVTRANALQRKGRAGRVQSGVCIHLYTHHRFRNNFISHPIPEIHRKPLESLLLNVKVIPNFAGKTLQQVLASMIEPPTMESIDQAIERLQHVGALDLEQKLTALGHHLALLPVDVRIGKLILYGAIFGCVDAALTMAACLGHKSPFVCPFNKKEQANRKKMQFYVARSDQLTTLVAYRKWREARQKSFAAGRNFAVENYMSLKTLETIVDVKYQLLEHLVAVGFVPINLRKRRRAMLDEVLQLSGSEFNANDDNYRLLSAIICAALYPNIVKILTPEKSYEMSIAGAVVKEQKSKDFKFKTKTDTVFLHPSSVNFIANSFNTPFLVYQEKVKTSKIFIRDSCMISLIALVLFSGFDLDIKVHKDSTYIVFEEGWVMFRVLDHRVAEMLKAIRKELQDLLEQKIADPLLNLNHHAKGEKIISTILYMITND